MAEGGPFSRSKFYFCSGMSKKKFIGLGGIDELLSYGVGYDDTLFREMWKNRYGQYEKEVTAEVIHLWHGASGKRSTWEVANSRAHQRLKHLDEANILRLSGTGELYQLDSPQWANPESISKIYTIEKGRITNVEDVAGGGSKELDLPF